MRTLGRAGVGGNPPNAKPLSPYAAPPSRPENGRQPSYQMYVACRIFGNLDSRLFCAGSWTLVCGLNLLDHHRCPRWLLRLHRNQAALVPPGLSLGMHLRHHQRDPRCHPSDLAGARMTRRRRRRRERPWRRLQQRLLTDTATVMEVVRMARKRDCSRSSGSVRREKNTGHQLSKVKKHEL